MTDWLTGAPSAAFYGHCWKRSVKKVMPSSARVCDELRAVSRNKWVFQKYRIFYSSELTVSGTNSAQQASIINLI
jgi:hypothetical protein